MSGLSAPKRNPKRNKKNHRRRKPHQPQREGTEMRRVALDSCSPIFCAGNSSDKNLAVQAVKQISNLENPKQRILTGLVLNFAYFGHSQLFRISGFVLRNFSLWRPAKQTC